MNENLNEEYMNILNKLCNDYKTLISMRGSELFRIWKEYIDASFIQTNKKVKFLVLGENVPFKKKYILTDTYNNQNNKFFDYFKDNGILNFDLFIFHVEKMYNLYDYKTFLQKNLPFIEDRWNLIKDYVDNSTKIIFLNKKLKNSILEIIEEGIISDFLGLKKLEIVKSEVMDSKNIKYSSKIKKYFNLTK